MKTLGKCIAAIIVASSFSACRVDDVAMTTTVFTDGSCIREVRYSRPASDDRVDMDSLRRTETPGPLIPAPRCISVDSMTFVETQVGDETVSTLYSGHYASVGEMSEATPLRIGGFPLRSTARLESRFRLFHTEYTFTETFAPVGRMFPIPMTDYVGQDTVAFWFAGKPTLTEGMSGSEMSGIIHGIEDKVTRWMNDNIVEVMFSTISENYRSVDDAPVPPEEFLSSRDAFLGYLKGKDVSLVDRYDPLNHTVECSGLFRDFFHSRAYDPFLDPGTELGGIMSRKLEGLEEIFTFDVRYVLRMPGTIVDGNFRTIEDGCAVFALTGERCIPEEYVVSATSRKANVWSYVVGLIIVCAAVGLWVAGRRS